MPTNTYTAIASITLGATSTSIDFANIPATYRDLVLVYRGTTGSADGVFCRVNGDTGSNYSLVRMGGNGTSPFGSTATTTYLPMLYSGSPVTGMSILQIMDYSATDKHKTALTSSSGAGYGIVEALASRWANTAAIYSLTLATTGSAFQVGTIASIYGIAS